MEYRRCTVCGDYAVVRMKGDRGRELLCLECMERDGEGRSMERYICSVIGCPNPPDHLVAIDEEGEWRTLLVCGPHFKEIGPRVVSYLSLPPWLTDRNDIILDENGITLEMDLGDRME